MALTMNSAPSPFELYSAYRPYVYQFESDDANIVSCVVEIFIDGSRVSARSVQPDLNTTDQFTIDIQKELQKYVSFELKDLDSSGVEYNDSGNNRVGLQIYEVTLVNNVLVTNYDPDNDNNLNYDFVTQATYFLNWTESHFDLAEFSFEDYRLDGTSKLLMTGNPSVKEIELDQDEFIGALWHEDASSLNFRLEVLTYDSTNALLNTDTISISSWNTAYNSTVTFPYITIGVGTRNLINAGISLTNVSYYTIKMINNTGDVSETRRYNIVGSCDSDVRIHFANKFGKQDSITLKGNVLESLDHKQENYQKALGLTYSSSSRGIASIQNISNKEFTAFSKSIGRDTLAFANSILINKIAYIEVNKKYFPIVIENGTSLIVNKQDMPIQFRLNYRLSNPQKGLRG